MNRRPIALVGAVACASSLLAASPTTGATPAPVRVVVRVNQVGYLPHDPKIAYAMTRKAARHATYQVVRRGDVVAHGRLGKDVGRWSKRWPHVYRIRFGRLDEPGTYRLVLGGEARGRSPRFRIGSGRRLYGPLRRRTVTFFRTQRDGANVPPGQLRRRPSHLTDRHARTYAAPTYRDGRLVGKLRKVDGPVDVSGGWFDAGDYLKFVETSSYADALLFVAARESPGDERLRREARYGLRWLDKMWRDRSRTLLYQVGIGDGNKSIVGDHDLWRLPQRDDRLDVSPGDPRYFIKHRPALRAGRPGARISPNLAGRLAAAFALGAQSYAKPRPARARALLRKARVVLGRARTSQVRRLLTTSPHAYYEEDEWRDDMEFGATEIAIAAHALGRPHVRRDLKRAAQWARAYVRGPHHGWYTLARNDTSAVAHADLARALAGRGGGFAVSRRDLVRDLRFQLRVAKRRYAPPLGYGGDEDPGSDFALGVAVTERLYRRLSHDRTYARLGTGMRDWVLGTNAWGSSFVIGAGEVYPHCPHHQVANLVGSRDGTRPQLAGGVSNGPAERTVLSDLGSPGRHARRCPKRTGNPFARFDGHGVRYRDDARAWAATEPAIDYVAVSALAFALRAR